MNHGTIRTDLELLAAKAAAAVDEQQLVERVRELVRIRSVYEPQQGSSEAAAAEHVATVLRRLGLKVTIEEAAPGRPNVVADWCGRRFQTGRAATLMFEGHTDVVTEGDPGSWRWPPFEARLDNGRIYGRGACDMKAGIAAAIAATQAVMETAPELPGRIRLGIVADEEGMMTGIKHFIEQGWADEVDGAIICEPEENELCLHQKGAMRVLASFHGVMSHGAMPYAGVNPIPFLGDFLLGVRRMEAKEQDRLGEHEHLGLPWLTPTIVRTPISGEAQFNVVPESALLALDIRTVPGQDHGSLWRELKQLASEVAAGDARLTLDLELVEERPWTETPPSDPLVASLERAYGLVFDSRPRYGGVPGATDGTFLHAWANVPIVTVGPGDRTVPHQRDEFVEVAEVVRSARLYAAAAVLYLGNAAAERSSR